MLRIVAAVLFFSHGAQKVFGWFGGMGPGGATANLMSLMEPAVILFLGVVIGGLVVSMYLPIFQLGSVLN